MAEETLSGDGDDVKKKVPLRPPNRRRYDEQVDQLMLTIRSLESELKSLGRPQPNGADGSTEDAEGREVLMAEQKRLREEREASIAKRKAFDEDLKTLTEQLSRQTDSLSKVDAGLRFKTDAAIDDAIRKLEHQLQTRHFKLSEENRIVKEIDSLRRSKRRVKEYLQQKQQIDVQRAKKKSLKDERDKYFRQVSSLKGMEDKVKQKLAENKSKTNEAWTRYREAGPKREALKKEIDELYERRRQLTAEFKQQSNHYHNQVKQHRADSFRRKEEEKRAQEEARKKQWEDYEASREPYEDERQLCSVLIGYLQRYMSPDQALPLGASAISPVQSPTRETTASNSQSGREDDLKSEFVILKKKTDDDDDVFLPSTAAKRKRNVRKHNRKPSWLSKPIRHKAVIFSQFESLGLRAPPSMGEVPDAIEQLTTIKDKYEAKCKDLKTVKDANCSTMPTNVPSASDQNPAPDSTTHDKLQPAASGESKLPNIDIQSARDHCTPGIESAPETPNSGDLESVDSGIEIQKLKGVVQSQTSVQNHKCMDTCLNTEKSPNMHTCESTISRKSLQSSYMSDNKCKNESSASIFRDDQSQLKDDIDSCSELLQSTL